MKMHRPGKTETYILLRDRESEKPTPITLRALTWKELDQVNAVAPMSMPDAIRIHAINSRAQFENRELTQDEQDEMNSIVQVDAQMLARMNAQHAVACGFGVVDVGTVYDDDNQPFTMTPAEFVDHLDVSVLRELGSHIIEISRYSEVQLKN